MLLRAHGWVYYTPRLPVRSPQVTSNAVRIMQFAKAMLRESQPVLMPHNSEPVQLRIGIHTGPLVSGLVGAKVGACARTCTCVPVCTHLCERCTLLP